MVQRSKPFLTWEVPTGSPVRSHPASPNPNSTDALLPNMSLIVINFFYQNLSCYSESPAVMERIFGVRLFEGTMIQLY